MLPEKEREAVWAGNENVDTTNGLTSCSQGVHTLHESFGKLPGVMTAANSLLGGAGLRPAVEDAPHSCGVLREECADGR